MEPEHIASTAPGGTPVVGPVDAARTPRWVGPGTFARLPRTDEVGRTDIAVVDPAHAPGTGTPEAGGMTSRELLEILRGLRGANVVGCDVVEVAPAYDHAEITGIAAAHTVYELVTLLAMGPGAAPGGPAYGTAGTVYGDESR